MKYSPGNPTWATGSKIILPLKTFGPYVQSSASSRAKHGGAYFSAVRGSMKDPIAVPGGHEVTGV